MCIIHVESIFSLENLEFVMFLSRSCSNQGRVGTNLTIHCACVYYRASFVTKVLRCAFLQCCQHVCIFENWSSFQVWRKRCKESGYRPQRCLSGTVVLPKPLYIRKSTSVVAENTKIVFWSGIYAEKEVRSTSGFENFSR